MSATPCAVEPANAAAVLAMNDAARAAASRSRERLHAYPPDLARLVLRGWRERQARGEVPGPLPRRAALEDLLSVAYQASLLREESRAVTFRLVVAPPVRFPEAVGPPLALHRLLFARPRPLDAHELRRLAPATDFARSLIGVRLSARGSHVWGLLHAGPHWSAGASPGSAPGTPLLVVSVSGPGHVMVTLDGAPLAELGQGRLDTSEVDVFQAPWMLGAFRGLDTCVPRGAAPPPGSAADFSGRLAVDVLRRGLGIMRAEQHGGLLIVLPSAQVDALRERGTLRLKYDFIADQSRRRLQQIAVDAWLDVQPQAREDGRTAWQAYLSGRATQWRDVDAALLEVSHLIASLSQVDGAVVLTDTLDIVGFGAEIGGHLPSTRRVAQALDLAATSRRWVRADRVGTRHRAAYRLCDAAQDAIVLVVSQDGGLRVIRWHEPAVTYWAQVARGPWDQ